MDTTKSNQVWDFKCIITIKKTLARLKQRIQIKYAIRNDKLNIKNNTTQV